MHYLVGVRILNIRFSATCNVPHQYFFDFGHENNFRMWIAYRKYSLCTGKTASKNLRKHTEDINKNSNFFLLRDSFKGIFISETDVIFW